MNNATRHNQGKRQLSFILSAPNALKGASAVMEFGAQKYARDNWKKGLDKHQIIDSLMRHLLQHLNGEEEDAESGLDHLFHVLTNALFLAEQYGIQSEPNKYVKEVSLADFWQPGCPPPAVPYNSIPCTNL